MMKLDRIQVRSYPTGANLRGHLTRALYEYFNKYYKCEGAFVGFSIFHMGTKNLMCIIFEIESEGPKVIEHLFIVKKNKTPDRSSHRNKAAGKTK